MVFMGVISYWLHLTSTIVSIAYEPISTLLFYSVLDGRGI
jgi:hypothetical protein